MCPVFHGPGVERPFYPGECDEESDHFETVQNGSDDGGVYGGLAQF